MEDDIIHPDLYFVVLPIHTMALLLAVSGNVSIIINIIRTPRLHTPSCSVMLVLALSDLMFSLVWNCVPLAAVDGSVREGLRSSWLCIFIGVSWQTAITLLAFLHGVVALDRYFFIVHPMKYQVHVTIKRSLLVAGVIFLIAGSIPGVLLLSGNRHVYSVPAMTCVGPSYWSITFLVAIFLPSLIVTLFSYQRIWNLCANAIKHDIVGSSRIFSPPVSGVCSRNTKTSTAHTCDQATSIARDDVIVHSMDDVNPKLDNAVIFKKMAENSKERSRLTTSTRIGGTTYPKKNGKTVKDVSQGQAFINIERMAKSKLEKQTVVFDEKHSHLKKAATTRMPYDFALPTSIESPLPLTETAATSPLRSICVEPDKVPHRRQTQSDHNAGVPVSPGGLTNVDLSVRPMLLQCAGIVNPVISWMLIQEWSQRVQSAEPRLHENFLSLPPTFLETQQNDRQRGVSISGRRRRLRACLMMVLPVFGMMAYFLPLIFCVMYWEYWPNSHSDFSVVFCHLCYAMAPSTVSLILSLSNKPYRRALVRKMCCYFARHS